MSCTGAASGEKNALPAVHVSLAEPVGGPIISRVTDLYMQEGGLVQLSRRDDSTLLEFRQVIIPPADLSLWRKRAEGCESTPPPDLSQPAYAVSVMRGIQQTRYERGAASPEFLTWWKSVTAAVRSAAPISLESGLYVRMKHLLPGQASLAKNPASVRVVSSEETRQSPGIHQALRNPMRWTRVQAHEERFHAHPKLDEPSRIRLLSWGNQTFQIEGCLYSRTNSYRAGLSRLTDPKEPK
jgi:hypothetical protein